MVNLIGICNEISEEAIEKVNEKEKLITDINIKVIDSFIAKIKGTGKLYYQNIYIGMKCTESFVFLWSNANEKNTKEEKKLLKKCAIFSDSNITNPDSFSARKYFDQKLEEWADEGKHRNIEGLLESYLELYDLQMKNQ